MADLKKKFSILDRAVERKFGFLSHFFKRYFPFVSAVFFLFILSVFLIRFFYSRPRIIASIIEDDIKVITLALKKIDERCNILSIENSHNEIDFLNVEKFTGSQVGPLALGYPKRWQGPYLRINPTLQGQLYEIVRGADGFFVMPGRGVLLPNGAVVGKDFIITPKTYVSDLLKEGAPLRYANHNFAVKLEFKIGDWDLWHMQEDTLKKLNRMLNEFREAIPYTQNTVQANYCA